MFKAYIRKYIRLHTIVCVLYAMMFFAEVVVMGELFYINGFNGITMEETTYAFSIKETDFDKLHDLLGFKGKIRDVCFVAKNNDFDIVCYPIGVDTERIETDGFGYNLDKGQIYLTETIYIPEVLGIEYFDLSDNDGIDICINDETYSYKGSVSINNTYPKITWPFNVYMCEEDFQKQLASSERVVVAYTFKEKLSKKETETLIQFANSVAPSTIYIENSNRTPELAFLLDKSNFYLWVVSFLAAMCFGRLILVLLNNRDPEYKVFELLGAKKSWIFFSKVRYVFVLLSVSGVIGVLAYFGVQKLTDNLLVYTNNSIAFWSACFVIYYSAAGLALIILDLIERIKYRYEN